MKTAFKKKLSLLLVLVLIVSLFAGLPFGAAAADTTKYLAFSSDLHYDSAKGANNLDTWLGSMKNVVKSVEYMAFLGDVGPMPSTAAPFWKDVQAVVDVADKYQASGFITKGSVYTMGNRENYTTLGGDYANNKDNVTAKKFVQVGEVAKTDSYILFNFGCPTTVTKSGVQEFTLADIATLKAYMDKAPDNIPIFLLSHFPMHDFAGKSITNAPAVLDILNAHPNVIMVWGHTHAYSDPLYDKMFGDGDKITIGGAEKTLKFTYLSAGCMSDTEYAPSSAAVLGKGLLAAIDGTKVTFKYYKLDGKALEVTKTVDVAAGTPVTPPAPSAGPVNAFRLSQKVTVNGVDKAFDAYGVDGRSYFKLRDIAFVLNGTGSQFSVDFDANNIFLKTGSAYVPAGGELVIGADKSSTAKLGTMALNIDGKVVSIKAYNIGGNNYFQLRELGDALNFKYAYVDATKTIQITSVEKAG